jgi:hypothetical protein
MSRIPLENRHLTREFLTITKMAGIYCDANHGSRKGELCSECADFVDYAEVRLQKCPYGDDKPTCANCPIHCYKPARREQAKAIMRYAGPRMILRHPLLAISHKLDGLRRAMHPKELGREQRLQSKRK